MSTRPERRRRVTAALIITLAAVTLAACGSDDAPSFETTFGADEASPTAPDQPTVPPPSTPNQPSSESGADPAADATPSEPLAPVSIPETLAVKLTRVVEVDRPIDMATQPGNDNIFIATKGGLVVEVKPSATGGEVVRELIDIADIIDDDFESGLLGIAFSPDGTRFYMSYSNRDHNNTVVEIPMDGDELVSAAGRTLLVVEQPEVNHNGGGIAFGPDAMLYIGLGDGGGSGDPFGNGQDTTTLLGSILRIDPGGEPYLIPTDNPFADGGGAAEIFLYGVRNPWRFSFDRATGDLWVADVGQDALEEIDVMYASAGWGRGANLGWNRVEGSAPFAATGPPSSNYVAPIFEYGRDEGCSVTGGYVYRGNAIPELAGSYVYGDYCSRGVWGLASSEDQGLLGRFDLGVSPGGDGLTSFGEGPAGELYVLTFPDTVYRIDPA